MGVNKVCTSLLTKKKQLEHYLSCEMQIKSCLAPCAISVTLPLSSHGARLVTSSTLYDISK